MTFRRFLWRAYWVVPAFLLGVWDGLREPR